MGKIENRFTFLGHFLSFRRRCEGEFMDGRSSMDVTQSEGDLSDFNQSEH